MAIGQGQGQGHRHFDEHIIVDNSGTTRRQIGAVRNNRVNVCLSVCPYPYIVSLYRTITSLKVGRLLKKSLIWG